MEMADATFDNSPITRGKERRRLEAQNQGSLMGFVVQNPPTDRVANEQTPRMTKLVDGLVELTKGLFVNFE
jgi:hypothetical protein